MPFYRGSTKTSMQVLLDILFISADLLAAFYEAIDVPEVYILACGLEVGRSIA